MIFKCKNCGANAIYSPEKKAMFCPFCDSEDSEEIARGESMSYCINCGGELHAGDHMSALKCEHCGSYVIFEERTEGAYEPHLILPFKVGKKKAQEIIINQYSKKGCIPDDFCSEIKMAEMEGMYVPFFMYDFDCRYQLTATGTNVHSWISGDTEYTETTTYNVIRDMSISFERIPIDASNAMPDELMDLIEPFNYEALEAFQAKYMSGFLAEKYNQTKEELNPRAQEKAKKDAESLMNATLARYSNVTDRVSDIQMKTLRANYSLIPVWKYLYTYKGKEYPFYVNGQTGRLVGNPPVSMEKVIVYGATVFGGIMLIGQMIRLIWGVL